MEVNNKNEIMPNPEIEEGNKTTFKKPILVGKIGRLPRKMVSTKTNTSEDNDTKEENSTNLETNINVSVEDVETNSNVFKSPAQQLTENLLVLPYKEPSWSGLPPKSDKEYGFEVLKSGVIVEQIKLSSKSFWVFGRSVNSDIYMAHPTISRYHAVLQYRVDGTEKDPPGFYIFDLNSTHGTFLNKGKLKSKVYAPVKVGHILKLGFSTRSYVLTGPDEDKEDESEFSLTELKQKRAEKLLKAEMDMNAAILKEEQEKEERRKRYEERGVDWGLGEDADAENDISENPFAQTNNEELYLDDPKKALRGFMEREGYSLDYDCMEQGFGQFLCKVELPLDDDHGRRIIAEVLHKGKKKEAVVQCALEACRILDRYGVLRQATHESRKRKTRNWEENDYYDSDDDTFLDRTGTVEKKREKRMNSKIPQQPETYQSLLEKEKSVSAQILEIENQLLVARRQTNQLESPEEDPLDLFMKDLKDSKPDKQTISKLKSELAALKTEHINIVKLVNLVKPADLPPLTSQHTQSNQTSASSVSKPKLPIFGKRKQLKIDLPQNSNAVFENENDEDEELDNPVPDNSVSNENESEIKTEQVDSPKSSPDKADGVQWYIKIYRKITDLETIMHYKSFPSDIDSSISQVSDVLFEIKNVIEQDGKLQMDKNLIMAKNRKVKKHIDNLLESYDEKHLLRICKELKRLYSEIQNMTVKQHEIFSKIRILAVKIDLISKEITKQINTHKEEKVKKLHCTLSVSDNENCDQIEEEDEDSDKPFTMEELEKRRKKNQKRNQHRKEKSEIEKQKGYQEDAQKEDYNMWLPPENQTGDGRTTLNEKYGY